MKKYLIAIVLLLKSVSCHAAVVETNLDSGYDPSNLSTYSTNSITPTARSLQIATVFTRIGTGPNNTPTITGCNLTWVLVDTVLVGTNRKLTTLRAMGAAPSAGVLSLDFGGQTQTQCIWSVAEFAGADHGGTNGSGAIAQHPTPTTGTGTSASLTLAALYDSHSVAYGATTLGSTPTITRGSGFTEIHNVLGAENGTSVETEYKENTTAVTSSWSGSQSWGMIGLEIKAEATEAVLNTATLRTATIN